MLACQQGNVQTKVMLMTNKMSSCGKGEAYIETVLDGQVQLEAMKPFDNYFITLIILLFIAKKLLT